MKEKPNQESEFYAELDSKTARHSCCTGQTMIIGFVVLGILVGFLTFYVANKIRYIGLPSKPTSTLSKFETNPDTNPTLTLTITAQDLNSLVGGTISLNGWQIENIDFSINELGIIIRGDLVKVFKFGLKMTAVPEVTDGKVKLKIKQATLGKVSMPGILKTEIEKALNGLLDENLKQAYENYQVTEVKLEQNQMLILGKLNGG